MLVFRAIDQRHGAISAAGGMQHKGLVSVAPPLGTLKVQVGRNELQGIDGNGLGKYAKRLDGLKQWMRLWKARSPLAMRMVRVCYRRGPMG